MIPLGFLSFLLSITPLQSFFTETESFKRSYVGIHVIDLETQREIYSSNADHYFIPASLLKIPISLGALTFLGEDFHFTTDLEYEGEVDKQGILHGNLWIQGGGDPTLSTTIFSQWKSVLEAAGINKIHGKIIVNSSCFETACASPYWNFQDLGNYYGSGASGLAINHNSYQITFKPGVKEGDPATVVKTEPPLYDLIVHNEVTTGPPGSGDRVNIFGSEYSPIQFYRGTVPQDQPLFTVKAALPNPMLFCGTALASLIPTSQGIEVTMQKMENSPPKKRLLHLESPPITSIIHEMNQNSVNLYAEHLLKTIGEGSAEKGTKRLEQFLKELGIPAVIKDGAGLARNNLLTPRGFTTMLSSIRKNLLYNSVYLSLPEANKSGTLKSFPSINNAILKAKTGSMSHVYNLGGFLTLTSGKEIAFCICCNNYEGPLEDIKKEIHRFLNEIAEESLTALQVNEHASK